MSDETPDRQIMETNIRNVMDHWTTILQSQLTDFFNDLQSDAWDEALELLQNNSEISLDDLAHYQSLNPYRKEPHDE